MNALATAPRAPVTTDGTALGIQRRLTELGRIRLGEKGARGEPKRLSKFRLTSASKALLDQAARTYGGTVRPWQGAPDDGFWELYTESDTLDILVPPTRSAYSQFYEVWDAGGCVVRCDGRWESIAEKPCDHGDHRDNPAMKLTTRVSVILPKLPGLGVWRLESHGWNAAATLPETLDLIGIVGRWIPATIRLQQQSSKERDPRTHKVTTHRFVVPVIDLAGVSFGDMLAMGQASDEYAAAPALGAGPGSLALPPGPARPPSSTKVPRPPLAPEPPLDDETAALTMPVGRPFPEEPDGLFEAAGSPAKVAPSAMADAGARNDVDLGTTLRATAAASDLEGVPNDEQRAALAAVFGTTPRVVILGGLSALWPDAVVDEKAALTAAQAHAIVVVADSFGPAFLPQFAALVSREAVPA